MSAAQPLTDLIARRLTPPYQHATLPAARIAQSMGIFDAFASAPPGAEMTVDALDTQTKGDRLLLGIASPDNSLQVAVLIVQSSAYPQAACCG